MDRNEGAGVGCIGHAGSLSARRAWIEMLIDLVDSPVAKVALRKESVDRNVCTANNIILPVDVALRKESVDRNILF